MKIGMISGEFAPMPGGVGDFARILAERITKHGHDVHMLSRAGCASDALPVSTVKNWGIKCLSPIQNWAEQNDFELINLQFQTAAYDMSPVIHFLSAALDQPFVTTFHDLRHPYLFPKAGRLRDWTVRHLAQSSDGVIVTNREDAASLAHLPLQTLIPIGSAIPHTNDADSSRSSWRERLGAAEATFLLGFFGFIQPIKGADYLIEALAELRQRDLDLRLVFIGASSNPIDSGADSAYRQQLDERIRKHALQECIHWTGFISDDEVAACLNAMDLITLPFLDGASYRRSTLIAAIHQGCAILTTQAAVETDSFKHGENLFFIPSHSSEEITTAIAQLMGNPLQLERLRHGARDLRSHFDWDVIATDTITFFEQVISATQWHESIEDLTANG